MKYIGFLHCLQKWDMYNTVVLGHTGKVMHGERGNRRTKKATSQNIFEMIKIIDGGLISL